MGGLTSGLKGGSKTKIQDGRVASTTKSTKTSDLTLDSLRDGSSTANTRSGLPDWLQDPLMGSITTASDLYSSAAPYSGATYVQPSAATLSALQGLENTYRQPNVDRFNDVFDVWNRTLQGGFIPGHDAAEYSARDELDKTIRGDYLYGGPGFNAAYQAAENRIIPRVTSAFNASGRLGGTAGQSDLTSRLGDSFAALYDSERGRQLGATQYAWDDFSRRYDSERGRMTGAIRDFPLIQSAQTRPYYELLGVGRDRESYEPGRIADELYRYNYPQTAFDLYQRRLLSPAGLFGTTDSTGTQTEKLSSRQKILDELLSEMEGTQPITTQSSGGGLGSLLGAGLSLAGMLGGGPIGLLGGGLAAGTGGTSFLSGAPGLSGPFSIAF